MVSEKHPLCMTFAKENYSISSQKAITKYIQVIEHSRRQLDGSSKIARVGIPGGPVLKTPSSNPGFSPWSGIHGPTRCGMWAKKKKLIPASCGAERTKSMERGCGEHSRQEP